MQSDSQIGFFKKEAVSNGSKFLFRDSFIQGGLLFRKWLAHVLYQGQGYRSGAIVQRYRLVFVQAEVAYLIQSIKYHSFCFHVGTCHHGGNHLRELQGVFFAFFLRESSVDGVASRIAMHPHLVDVESKERRVFHIAHLCAVNRSDYPFSAQVVKRKSPVFLKSAPHCLRHLSRLFLVRFRYILVRYSTLAILCFRYPCRDTSFGWCRFVRI